MSTKIKVGDTVRIKENYPHATLTGNKIGAEFVVKEVVGDTRLTRLLGYKFYVTGDAQGHGVWDLFIEKVESRGGEVSAEFDEANEIAKAAVERVMTYANFEGLAPAGIAQAAFRMGYMEAMKREQEEQRANWVEEGNKAHAEAIRVIEEMYRDGVASKGSIPVPSQ
ncbi:hypothetical protein SEA_LYELL_114 [Microbacterium phage Lyell]|nr:hypothetical protein SEA_LYELL_114 [Microbacterium phage Lyell]